MTEWIDDQDKEEGLHILRRVSGEEIMNVKFDILRSTIEHMFHRIKRHHKYDPKPDHDYIFHLSVREVEISNDSRK